MTQPRNVLEGQQQTSVKVLSLLNPTERICSHLLSPHEMHPDSSEMKDVNGERGEAETVQYSLNLLLAELESV